MYLLYLLFFPTSVMGYAVLLLLLMSLSTEKLLIMVLLLVVWFLFNFYILLMIIRSKFIISGESLIYMTAFRTIEIPYSRVMAYKSYDLDRSKLLWGHSLRSIFFPIDRIQHWIEIHYKDYNGKKRTLRQDITNFASADELIKNLDHYLKK
jgi:hypothetical protein